MHLGDDTQSWASQIQSAAQSLIGNAKDVALVNLQLERAKAGLPPLPTDQAQALVQNVMGGVSPMMLAGAGVAALGVLLVLRRRRKAR